ncbi:MAG: AAA family ATPase, partial [Candidatus Rokubacteria bacterium]|nr:AAA family ATPase [Candidatus Rokubacteria bacterium]
LPGITAVVGPNGCGKSNISDAVRWALGEQSAKSLRGSRMEDLIFHGSASHKPLGLADVELVFANDGAVAVPWSEVGVGRRLYRTGESEYLLNRNVCRLRDILDLFIGTGVNPKAYALMDQERLNHVLTAKPYERRVFIEEAAGITRYKQQRAETLGKLDATRQNLLRVRDVMDEVKRQLGSIERQAKKAQQYKTLHAEQQGLALALLAADYSALARQEVEHRERIDALRREEEVTRVRMAGLAAQEATQRSLIQETEHRLSDLHQSVQKIQGEVPGLPGAPAGGALGPAAPARGSAGNPGGPARVAPRRPPGGPGTARDPPPGFDPGGGRARGAHPRDRRASRARGAVPAAQGAARPGGRGRPERGRWPDRDARQGGGLSTAGPRGALAAGRAALGSGTAIG